MTGRIEIRRRAYLAGAFSLEEEADRALGRLRALPMAETPFAALEPARSLAQAAALDRARARGDALGPLAGALLAHKDMFDREGFSTGFGAHFSRRQPAAGTATVLSRLDAAGQVDLGRLKMSEFAMGPTGHNHHHGMPANPAVPGAITGGSSSGSGAAVAAGHVAAALGSDTGGSIRLPAACNGVVGFKPTQGRAPMDRTMPLGYSQDCVGPLAATVADAQAVLSLIAPLPPAAPKPVPVAELRVGFDTGAFTDGISARMRHALSDLVARLAAMGARPVGLDLAFLSHLGEPANVTAMAEAAAVHADALALAPDSYGPQVRARLVQAAAIPAHAYLRAQQIRRVAHDRLTAEAFGRVDLLLLPTLADTPPQAALLDVGDGPGVDSVVAGLTRLTRPASFLGLPALSLPIARLADGPLSVQVIGPAWADDRVAALALTIETALALPAIQPEPEYA
ncbi:amidase [Rubellimicrobium aerolatum]|uniref:Amidase n=1 Tax=Rubellimicrobium aerolatum TaxID=490979 RepID=A0ABW0SCM0_9RHOB|nr:amidase [Rubellimicrobium aerolatum]MBP1806275.1 aspartyl-tRNA(Asn)/glutamyl-tRNA(Gln) amidotransferase subunit A [Rubellimicrobium aerolatum]